jgi:hypothetical protein
LREFKSKRGAEFNVRKNQAEELDRVLKNQKLSEAEKYNLMRIKTNKLEQMAEQEERVLSILGTDRNVDRTIEVNDMYIESIKAKLMMLDQI